MTHVKILTLEKIKDKYYIPEGIILYKGELQPKKRAFFFFFLKHLLLNSLA